MTGQGETTTVGTLPTPGTERSRVPATLTRLVWVLWVVSCGALLAHLFSGETWSVTGLVTVDGLTVTMWATVTFFSGIVHSYSRRYMAGSRTIDEFFTRVFAFTLVVMVLVAADSLLVFAAAWLVMGLVMAELVGHVRGWKQARAAAAVARRYFLASSGVLSVGLAVLWWTTGATTISGVATATGSGSPTVLLLVAAGALVLAAMVQSALLPFHTWLLSSMTAPTPASALMHAGFVNAGGILLVRFAPVVTVDAGVMLAIVLVGATSAIGGKLMKTVQTDVKGTLGCSTVGQMGFMLMQAGLGFFAAAITHLVLHGFYKAYHFLASGSSVAHESPSTAKSTGSPGVVGAVVVAITALAGGAVFALLTGKGLESGSGLLLTLLVVLSVLLAARGAVADTSLPTTLRYGAVPAVALPAIAVYAAVYRVVEGLLAGLPAVGQPAELTVVHGVVALAFVAAFVAIETGVYRRSERLYVALLNATQPARETMLTSREDYNEY
ncbi:proton-conducting transporter transmembrane domain-containing protein [Haloarchaeobius amylolyticus]|uniref:proton-conducting transporter transmembrane domain-containing protein n=1 Tax=Haloarchaeobius amylolyticus TaxID=1198296 RepID=UPI0022705DC0|nr:proton-conducting transporter membrane subunit [Haloarchaeobius amylolyticus]